MLVPQGGETRVIDIHSHILGGVDDGSADSIVSMQMLREASAAGVKAIVATPHSGSDRISLRTDGIIRRVKELASLAADDKLASQVNIIPGAEIMLDPGVPQMVADGLLPCLGAKGRYVLVEIPMLQVPPYTDDVLFDLVARGFTPILAHPERNHELSEKLDMVYDIIGRGCLMQLEAGSLVGRYGPEAQAAAWRMLEHNMGHFLASDAHSPRTYRSVLPEAIEEARRQLGDERAHELFHANAEAVLEGRRPDVAPPIRPGCSANNKKTGIISRFQKWWGKQDLNL